MKRKIQSIIMLGLLILASCGSDEDPEPPHIVGSWDLENFIIINLPTSYSRNEGRTFQINELTFGGATFSSYNLDIAADGTYIRKIGFAGSPSANDQGAWTLSDDGNDLNIAANDDDTGVDWDVAKNELDQLWLTQPSTFGFISDATINQLEDEHGEGLTEYLNGLTDEEFDALVDPVIVDLLYAFTR